MGHKNIYKLKFCQTTNTSDFDLECAKEVLLKGPSKFQAKIRICSGVCFEGGRQSIYALLLQKEHSKEHST